MKLKRDSINLVCQFTAHVEGMEEFYLLPMIIYEPLNFDIDSDAGIRMAVEYILDTIKAAKVKIDYDETHMKIKKRRKK